MFTYALARREEGLREVASVKLFHPTPSSRLSHQNKVKCGKDNGKGETIPQYFLIPTKTRAADATRLFAQWNLSPFVTSHAEIYYSSQPVSVYELASLTLRFIRNVSSCSLWRRFRDVPVSSKVHMIESRAPLGWQSFSTYSRLQSFSEAIKIYLIFFPVSHKTLLHRIHSTFSDGGWNEHRVRET